MDNDSKIFTAGSASQQLQALETKGTAYGKHFNLQGLTERYKPMWIILQKVWNYDQRATDHWCKEVGGEQKLLPAHIVNEYCRPDRSFEPCPAEWVTKLPRTQEVKRWNPEESKYVKDSWFKSFSFVDKDERHRLYFEKRGFHCAFLRYNGTAPVSRGRGKGCKQKGPRADLESAPILVEDAHAAVRGSKIAIIIRAQSEPRIGNKIGVHWERYEIRNATGSTAETNAATSTIPIANNSANLHGSAETESYP